MGLKSVLPSYLKKGDFVTLVAPASAFELPLFEKGVACLKALGLEVLWQDGIFERQGYLAGSDSRRFQELQSALQDRRNKAVLVARGGYGSLRLLFTQKKIKIPRPLVMMGMSDVTCLLNWIPSVYGFSTIHGPVIAGTLLNQLSDGDQTRLLSGLFEPTEKKLKSDVDYTVARSGEGRGILVGGNLAMLEAGLGTPWETDTKNAVLFLEDIHEPPYKLDRMLTHLALAGKFKRLKGLILGDFSDTHEKDHDPHFLKRLILDLVPQGIPVLQGIHVGHHRCKFLLPLGQMVDIKQRGKQCVIPPCVGDQRG